MEPFILIPLAAIAGLIIGIFIAKFFVGSNLRRKQQEIDRKADLMLEEARSRGESIKQEKVLEAKEHFLKLKEEFETEANGKKNQLINNERKQKQQEQNKSTKQEKTGKD